MPPNVKTFQELVQWLIDRHHDGVTLAMAHKLRCNPWSIYKWAAGLVQKPSIEMLQRLCAAYDLDFAQVLALVYNPRRRPRPPVAGGSAAVPHHHSVPDAKTLRLMSYSDCPQCRRAA